MLWEHPSQGGAKVAKTSTPFTWGRTGPRPPGGRSQPGERMGLLWASRVMLRIKHGQTVTILMFFLRPERQKVLIIDARLLSFPLSASDDLRGGGAVLCLTRVCSVGGLPAQASWDLSSGPALSAVSP